MPGRGWAQRQTDRQTDRRRPPRREGRTKRLTTVLSLTLRRATTTASPHHPATSSSHQAAVHAYSLPPASPPWPPRCALSPPCVHVSRPLPLSLPRVCSGGRCSLLKTMLEFLVLVLVVVVAGQKLVPDFHFDPSSSAAGRFCSARLRSRLLPQRCMLAPAARARPPVRPARLHLRACPVALPCC